MADLENLMEKLPKIVTDNEIRVNGQWSGDGCLIDSLNLGPGGLCRVSSSGMIDLDFILSEEGRTQLNQYSLESGGNESIQEWFGFLFQASPEWGGCKTYDDDPPVGTEYLHASLGWPCKSIPTWDAAGLESALGYPGGELVEAVEAGLTAAPELVNWSDLSHESRASVCSALGGGSSSDVFFEPLMSFVISTLGDRFSSEQGSYTWDQLGAIS